MSEGDLDHDAVMAGQIVPLVTKEETSAEIIDRVMNEAKEVLKKMPNFEM